MAGPLGMVGELANIAVNSVAAARKRPDYVNSTAPYSSARREAAAAAVAPDSTTSNTNRANRAANMLGDGMIGGARDALRNTTSRRMRDAGLE